MAYKIIRVPFHVSIPTEVHVRLIEGVSREACGFEISRWGVDIRAV